MNPRGTRGSLTYRLGLLFARPRGLIILVFSAAQRCVFLQNYRRIGKSSRRSRFQLGLGTLFVPLLLLLPLCSGNSYSDVLLVGKGLSSGHGGLDGDP